jgi:hypothetical protein
MTRSNQQERRRSEEEGSGWGEEEDQEEAEAEYEAVRGYQVRASPDPPRASDDNEQDAEITRIVDDIEASLKIKAPRKSRKGTIKTVQSE